MASPPTPTVFHGIAARGAFDIVDAQLHLSPHPSLEGVTTAMDALGIRTVIFDELWGRNEKGQGTPCIELGQGAYRPLSPIAQAAALQDPARYAWLQRVTRRDPGLSEQIPLLAALPGCVALRLVIFDKEEITQLLAGAYDEALYLAQQHEMPLCLLARDVGQVLQTIVPRFPRLSFVVDHCGWVRKSKHWDEVLELAALDNVCLKWSHFHRAFGDGEVNAGGVQDAFRQAIQAFGAERVLWAGDITHEETSATWAQLLGFILENPELKDTEREYVLGKTARRVFGLAF